MKCAIKDMFCSYFVHFLFFNLPLVGCLFILLTCLFLLTYLGATPTTTVPITTVPGKHDFNKSMLCI